MAAGPLEAVLASFGWGYFWSIATAAYLLLRRDVDGTEKWVPLQSLACVSITLFSAKERIHSYSSCALLSRERLSAQSMAWRIALAIPRR